MELAHKYVEELEADYEIERGRFPENRGPDFKRLPPPARFRFLQMAYDIQKTRQQIVEEAERRLLCGEILPPSRDAQTEEVISRKGLPNPFKARAS
ncbi:MAG: hypothetical protein HYT49_01010 [Candidatus Wildermuthbacteria bacterium]|nr:hypothetical protein [Candidatus Wildermuthbacteria bacterium]